MTIEIPEYLRESPLYHDIIIKIDELEARLDDMAGGSTGPVTIETMPPGFLLVVAKSGSTWPARPTARTDLRVAWLGPDPGPAQGGTGAMNNVDVRWRTPS